jgi:hypothetical protein
MFGSFSRSGVNIEIPKDFSPKSVLIFIMSVLGFTKEWILDRVAKVIGRQNVERLKKVYEFVKQLLARGLVGMYDYIKTKVGNLKDQIIEEVKSWVIVQIIKAAIIKLVSMFNPASAIVQAVLTIIDVVLFFANNIDLILRVLETIVDSVYKVVKGQIQGAADMIERALAMGLALAIRFLARFAKISGIVGKISGIIKRFKGRITRAVDKALKAIASKVKGLLGKGKAFVKKTAGKIAQWWKKRKTFKVEDKRYSVYTEGNQTHAKLFVSSSPGLPYSEFLKKYPSSTEKTQAIKLAQQLEKPKPRKEDPITNANKKVALFNKISTLMVKIAKTRGKLPPTAIRFGSVRKDCGGTEMKASILSKDHPKGTGVQDKDTKIWTDLGSLRKGSGKESNPFIQGHLLNDNIGGPGRMWNLTPIRENANKRHLHDVEKHVKNWIGKGNVAYYDVQTDYPSAPRRTSEHVTLEKKQTLTSAERKKLKALREGQATRRLVNKLICTAWKLEYDNGSWKQAKAKQELPGMKSKTVNVYNK